MNYIELINGFWLMDEQRSFTANETRLYFYLLYLANRRFWETQWLEYGDDKVQATEHGRMVRVISFWKRFVRKINMEK